MQTCKHSTSQLAAVANGCDVLAKQFDKGGSVADTLEAASGAIRELLFYRRLTDQPDGGAKIYTTAATDAPGIIRPGEPLPRPFVVGIMPYARWIIFSASSERLPAVEGELTVSKLEIERQASLIVELERLLLVERAKRPCPLSSVTPLEESEESWQASAVLNKPNF